MHVEENPEEDLNHMTFLPGDGLMKASSVSIETDLKASNLQVMLLSSEIVIVLSS